MTDEKVPVAVIGAGNMGANHIRVYDHLPEAELVAVVDQDEERRKEVSKAYDVEVRDSVSDLSGVRAVSICVPNEHHRAVAERCATEGADILVEKPLALTIEEAEAIVDIAEENDILLQVGHIERFNPALTTLEEILENEELIALEAHRLGPFNQHLTTESVVFDLMIHDIDVIDGLTETGLSHLDAVGTVSRSKVTDHAIAQFKFENSVVGTATASHVTHGKIRRLDVTTRDAYITLEYQEQNLTLQRRGREQTTTLHDQGGYRTETVTETPFVKGREPLRAEIEHFLDCVRDRRTPRIDGSDGVRAVQLATSILDRIRDR